MSSRTPGGAIARGRTESGVGGGRLGIGLASPSLGGADISAAASSIRGPAGSCSAEPPSPVAGASATPPHAAAANKAKTCTRKRQSVPRRRRAGHARIDRAYEPSPRGNPPLGIRHGSRHNRERSILATRESARRVLRAHKSPAGARPRRAAPRRRRRERRRCRSAHRRSGRPRRGGPGDRLRVHGGQHNKPARGKFVGEVAARVAHAVVRRRRHRAGVARHARDDDISRLRVRRCPSCGYFASSRHPPKP